MTLALVSLLSLALGWYVGVTGYYLAFRHRLRDLDHERAELLALRDRLKRVSQELAADREEFERRERISRGLREVFLVGATRQGSIQ